MIRLKNLIDKEPFEFRRLSRSAFYNLIRKNIERGLVRSALNNLEVDLSIKGVKKDRWYLLSGFPDRHDWALNTGIASFNKPKGRGRPLVHGKEF